MQYYDNILGLKKTECLSCKRFKVQISGWPNLTQHYKRFATVSISTQIAVCCHGEISRRWPPVTHYTLQR